MGITIEIVRLGTVATDHTFMVANRTPGTQQSIPVNAFLIRGALDGPILVDTGWKDHQPLLNLGFTVDRPPNEELSAALEAHGTSIGEIELVISTHLHLDHSGGVEQFPMSTPVMVNRRELEFAASGLQWPAYDQRDVQQFIERIYQPGALRFLDLEGTGPVEVAPGVFCESAGGHTPGMLAIDVVTDEGVARICGDVFYDPFAQIVEPPFTLAVGEPGLTGFFVVGQREERIAMKRALNGTRFLLPSHDRPWVLQTSKIVGSVEGSIVPGPIQPLESPLTATAAS